MARLWIKFNNLHLRTKLITSYSIVILILVLFWGISSYAQMNSQLADLAQREFDKMVTSTTSRVQNKTDRAVRALLVMARNGSVIELFSSPLLTPYQQADMVNNHFDPLLANINDQNEYISQVRVIATVGPLGVRHYFRDASRLSNEDQFLQNCTSEPTWQFSGSVLAVSCKLAGIDLGADAASISYIIDREEFFSDCIQGNTMATIVQVLDEEGQVIYSNSGSETILESDMQLLFTQVEDYSTGWRICFYANPQNHTLPVVVTLRTTAISVVLALMLIVPLMLLMSWGFSRRIQALKEKVAKIVPSHYEMEISSAAKDEIGEITNAIGAMVEDSRRRILCSYQESINRRDAKIQALQAQINPHFLYNTLSKLNWRAIRNGDMEMSKLLNAMSRFYRMTLNKGEILSTIGDEIEHAKLYIRIQCAVHNAELAQESYEVDQDLLDYQMPTVILQPLVENAVEHGFGGIGFENGKLRICVYKDQEQIVIRVSDNGTEISPEKAQSIFEPQKGAVSGYGLRNVYDRLRLLFEEEFTMTFETEVTGGTAVVLRVPPYVQP